MAPKRPVFRTAIVVDEEQRNLALQQTNKQTEEKTVLFVRFMYSIYEVFIGTARRSSILYRKRTQRQTKDWFLQLLKSYLGHFLLPDHPFRVMAVVLRSRRRRWARG